MHTDVDTMLTVFCIRPLVASSIPGCELPGKYLDERVNHLWAGKPSSYVIGYLGQLSLLFSSHSCFYSIRLRHWMAFLCWCAVKRLLTRSLNSAFHPSGVGKSSTGLSGWLVLRRGVFTCIMWQVCVPLWQVTPAALKRSFIKSSILLNLA